MHLKAPSPPVAPALVVAFPDEANHNANVVPVPDPIQEAVPQAGDGSSSISGPQTREGVDALRLLLRVYPAPDGSSHPVDFALREGSFTRTSMLAPLTN